MNTQVLKLVKEKLSLINIIVLIGLFTCVFLLDNCNFCAGGTKGKCSADNSDANCEDLMKLVCKQDGESESYVTSGSNGCSNCPDLRRLCATSCNYCTPDGMWPKLSTTSSNDQQRINSTNHYKSTEGIMLTPVKLNSCIYYVSCVST